MQSSCLATAKVLWPVTAGVVPPPPEKVPAAQLELCRGVVVRQQGCDRDNVQGSNAQPGRDMREGAGWGPTGRGWVVSTVKKQTIKTHAHTTLDVCTQPRKLARGILRQCDNVDRTHELGVAQGTTMLDSRSLPESPGKKRVERVHAWYVSLNIMPHITHLAEGLARYPTTRGTRTAAGTPRAPAAPA